MNGRLHFFDQTIIDEAMASQLAHPSCTMDDPLTAAIGHMQDEAAAAREADEPYVAAGLLDALRGLTKRERALLGAGAVFVLALVSAVSWVWPWGFAK